MKLGEREDEIQIISNLMNIALVDEFDAEHRLHPHESEHEKIHPIAEKRRNRTVKPMQAKKKRVWSYQFSYSIDRRSFQLFTRKNTFASFHSSGIRIHLINQLIQEFAKGKKRKKKKNINKE